MTLKGTSNQASWRPACLISALGISEPVKVFCLHASPGNRQRCPTEYGRTQDDDRVWIIRRSVGIGVSGMLYVHDRWLDSPVSRATTNRACHPSQFCLAS